MDRSGHEMTGVGHDLVTQSISLTEKNASSIVLPVRLFNGYITMAELATTRMSSKGQVVIPEEIRKRLGLEAGSQFIVVAGKDAVILKTISPPSMDEFDELIRKARQQARKAGMKRSDIKKAVAEVRGRR
jgi:AbrB family looped-hinge helix DNA binding protein